MMDAHISRSSILYGTGNNEKASESWYHLEQFQMDHIQEINHKLDILDDEIWGKIILMEKNKRIAKAYLRTTTVIVDGGMEKFDGKTIGFNAFVNHDRDSESDMIRWKINEGVAMKIDDQGNILARALGMSPVFVQGLTGSPNSNTRQHCSSMDLVKSKGRLESYDRNREIINGNEKKNRIFKIFDMKKFKADIENYLSLVQQGYSSATTRKNLLLKSCVRISLVKNDDRQAMKSPCWFMLVNLVALDMLNAKVPPLPNTLSSGPGPPGSQNFLCQESLQRSQHLSQSAGDLYGTLANPGVMTSAASSPLGRFLASQTGAPSSNSMVTVTSGLQWGMNASQDHQNFSLNPGGPIQPVQTQANNTAEQLAALANSLAMGFNTQQSVGNGAQPRNMWKPVSTSYLADGDNPNGIGNAAAMLMHRSRQLVTSGQEAQTARSNRPINEQCPSWGMAQSMDSLYEPIGNICVSGNEEFDEEDCPTSAAAAAAAAKASVRSKSKKFEPFPKNASWSNGSASDYESTKDIYDSSISSSSSRSSNSANGRSSPSIVSETASEQTSESGYVDSAIQRCIRPTKETKIKNDANNSSHSEELGSRHIALVQATVHAAGNWKAKPAPRQAPRLPQQSSVEDDTTASSNCSSPDYTKAKVKPAAPPNPQECSEYESEVEAAHVFKRSPPIAPHRRRRPKAQAPMPPPSPQDPTPKNVPQNTVWNF